MLRPWQMQFWLENSAGHSFHSRLTNQLIKDIQTGRLLPSTMMPGTRVLAKQLEVNRKTVQLVYEELESQGWLISVARKGTFVADVLPEKSLSNRNRGLVAFARETQPVSTLKSKLYTAALSTNVLPTISNDGVPDVRLIPYEIISKAYRRALIQSSKYAYLGYGDPRGTLELRTCIQQMLILDRYMNISLDQVCVVRGSQMGIFLVSRILNPAKGVIVVEKLSYPSAVAAFEASKFKVIRCELDSQGMDLDMLNNLLQEHEVAGVYTTAHHQYPTTVSLSMERRLKLLSLSKKYGFAVIEDDYDHEFHYESQPLPPLASLPNNENVIHIGSMSKVFAPGLRLGYMVANAEIIAQAAQEIVLIDRQGNTVTELAVADLMRSGEVKKHIRKVRKIYKERRDFAATEFSKVFGDDVSFQLPAGGMALWVNISKLAKDLKLSSLQHQDIGFNTLYNPEDRALSHIRFGFGALTESEISYSVKALANYFNQRACHD